MDVCSKHKAVRQRAASLRWNLQHCVPPFRRPKDTTIFARFACFIHHLTLHPDAMVHIAPHFPRHLLREASYLPPLTRQLLTARSSTGSRVTGMMTTKDVKSKFARRTTIYACVGQSAVVQKGITFAYFEHSSTTSLGQPLFKFRGHKSCCKEQGPGELRNPGHLCV